MGTPKTGGNPNAVGAGKAFELLVGPNGSAVGLNEQAPEPGDRVLIVSDIRFIREGLALVLSADHSFAVIGVATGLDEALETSTRVGHPDLVVLDAALPSGRDIARVLTQRVPESHLVVFAVNETAEEVIAWAEAGVTSYLPRTAALADLVRLLRQIVCGEQASSSHIVAGLLRRIAVGPRNTQSNQAPPPVLTNREREVVRFIVSGLSNKDIARRLNIAVSTVKSHVHNVLGKMELTTRGQLAPRLRGAAAGIPDPVRSAASARPPSISPPYSPPRR